MINHNCLNSERFPILRLSIFLLGANLAHLEMLWIQRKKKNEKGRLTIRILLIPEIFSQNVKLFKPS